MLETIKLIIISH